MDSNRYTEDFTPRSQDGSETFPEVLQRKETKHVRSTELNPCWTAEDNLSQLPSTESVDYSILNKVESSKGFQTNRPKNKLRENPRQVSVRLPTLGSLRPQTCDSRDSYVKIPSFVQLETLRAGECFVSSQNLCQICHYFCYNLSVVSFKVYKPTNTGDRVFVKHQCRKGYSSVTRKLMQGRVPPVVYLNLNIAS